MFLVAFEPTTPVFERAKTVHVLDRAATVIGDVFNFSVESHYFLRDCNVRIIKNYINFGTKFKCTSVSAFMLTDINVSNYVWVNSTPLSNSYCSRIIGNTQ
jgi:hypothetical protein